MEKRRIRLPLLARPEFAGRDKKRDINDLCGGVAPEKNIRFPELSDQVKGGFRFYSVTGRSGAGALFRSSSLWLRASLFFAYPAVFRQFGQRRAFKSCPVFKKYL